MAPAPQSLSGIFSFFTVYDLHLWLLIFGTFILISLIGRLMYWLAPEGAIGNKKKKWKNVSFEIIVICSQPMWKSVDCLQLKSNCICEFGNFYNKKFI
jgi:hypothetical protein